MVKNIPEISFFNATELLLFFASTAQDQKPAAGGIRRMDLYNRL